MFNNYRRILITTYNHQYTTPAKFSKHSCTSKPVKMQVNFMKISPEKCAVIKALAKYLNINFNVKIKHFI